jgi:hypothetical protein
MQRERRTQCSYSGRMASEQLHYYFRTIFGPMGVLARRSNRRSGCLGMDATSGDPFFLSKGAYQPSLLASKAVSILSVAHPVKQGFQPTAIWKLWMPTEEQSYLICEMSA